MQKRKIMKNAQLFDLLYAYGWAILLILISASAFFYFALIRDANLVETACEFPTGLSCIDAPQANASIGKISFRLANTLGYTIASLNATSEGNANCKYLNTSSEFVADTTVVQMNLMDCSLEEGGKFNDEVTISFKNKETGEEQKKVGKIIGRGE